MMLTDLRCWGQNHYVGDFFVMLLIFSMYLIGHQHPESVTTISKLSPTHLVSNIRHQHRCNLKLFCHSSTYFHVMFHTFPMNTLAKYIFVFCPQMRKHVMSSICFILFANQTIVNNSFVFLVMSV